jgi:hypothetical protein
MQAQPGTPIVDEEVARVDAATAAKQMTGLRDAAMPPSVPWWPPAAGWYVVLAVLALAVAFAVRGSIRRWRAAAYRRAALAELSAIEGRAADRAAAIREINALLKRVRLSETNRAGVAALSGAAWTRDLNQTAPGGQALTGAPGRVLEDVYGPDAGLAGVSDADFHSMVRSARGWIATHHAGAR